jgi:hypothetical protein
MFGAFLILAASVLFLVKNDTTLAAAGNLEPTDPQSEESHVTRSAIWSASVSLAIVMFSMTCIAVLNRALDKPKTLVINSRWVRLAPRLAAIVFIVCFPLIKNITGASWCASVSVTLWIVFMWEMAAGLEKGWKFFEPQGKE